MSDYTIKQIAHMQCGYMEKFGIPRQAGLAQKTEGKIVFESEYRNAAALKGLEQFSHIWLIWQFSENIEEKFQPQVRPPRFGGNEKIGVFATRSPFRPNALGLSCVKIQSIDTKSTDGPFIYVEGADLMNNTPIYDIKPYIPYADSIPGAAEGYALRPNAE